MMDHGLRLGCRSASDFIRHFSPASIMEGLKEQPALRAQILTPTTGTRTKIALKKSWQSSGEDLQIALDEGETNPAAIVELFKTDDRVRYLDVKALWTYMIEGRIWLTKVEDEAGFTRAKRHIAYILDSALEEELITHRDIVEGISVEKLAEFLPRAALGKIVTAAFSRAHSGRAFAEADLIGEIPSAELVKHLPLPLIWDRVLVARVAQVHGFMDPKMSDVVPPKPDKPEQNPSARLADKLTPAKPRTVPPELPKSAPERTTAKGDADMEDLMEAVDEATNPGSLMNMRTSQPHITNGGN